MKRLDEIVVVERHIQASPATVFSFFSSTERWLQWQGVEATLDPRPGGVFRINVSGDGFASGRFLEVVPDRLVRFTWGWEMPERRIPPESSTVEIELRPEGSGTLLRLTHAGLPPDWVDRHRQGWEKHLAQPQCYIRVFVDEGPSMAALLRQVWTRAANPDHIATLLAALESGPHSARKSV